ncbi:MAG TPA: TetR/AcrR family transcriptional regulator [Caulobacteraceae bacterium]|nr:TetR/AcrR family transcriptional regulator [Caulobacteraceae bacterium]
MRYGAEHKEETRKRVLKAAAKAIRAEGPHRIAVAGVMAEVGLTHGGFYAHFKSKDDLVAASIDQMFAEGVERARREMEGVDPATGLGRYIDFYLSAPHRDARGAGCPLPYLSADAPRMDPESRARFAEGAAQLTDRLAGLFAGMGDPDPSATASSLLAEMVGALSLARADPDPARSDAILERSRAALKTRFGLSADPSSETSP